MHAADVLQKFLCSQYFGPQKMIAVDTEPKLKCAGKTERSDHFRFMYGTQCADCTNKVRR